MDSIRDMTIAVLTRLGKSSSFELAFGVELTLFCHNLSYINVICIIIISKEKMYDESKQKISLP